jgi:hypothetical protein
MSITGVPYANEYTFIMDVRRDEDGKQRISGVQEMCDSLATTTFLEKMKPLTPPPNVPAPALATTSLSA